jgi:hypothetical protein
MRGISGALGFIGGLLMIFGGIVAFVYGVGYLATAQPAHVITTTFLVALGAVIFGIIVVVVTGTTHMRWMFASAGIPGGIILVILGILTWVLVGKNWIIVTGSILTVVGGLVAIVAAALFRAHRAAERDELKAAAPPPPT